MAHIKEINERLDYATFWAHGHSLKEWGPMGWEIFQGLADTFPCGTCRPGAQALTHGGHDVINLFQHKRVRTPQHLERLFDMVDQAKKIYYGEHCHGSGCAQKVRTHPVH